jgi:hypothetical protein
VKFQNARCNNKDNKVTTFRILLTVCQFVVWWPTSFLYLNDRHLWSKNVVEIRLSIAVKVHMHTQTCIVVYKGTSMRDSVRLLETEFPVLRALAR